MGWRRARWPSAVLGLFVPLAHLVARLHCSAVLQERPHDRRVSSPCRNNQRRGVVLRSAALATRSGVHITSARSFPNRADDRGALSNAIAGSATACSRCHMPVHTRSSERHVCVFEGAVWVGRAGKPGGRVDAEKAGVAAGSRGRPGPCRVWVAAPPSHPGIAPSLAAHARRPHQTRVKRERRSLCNAARCRGSAHRTDNLRSRPPVEQQPSDVWPATVCRRQERRPTPLRRPPHAPSAAKLPWPAQVDRWGCRGASRLRVCEQLWRRARAGSNGRRRWPLAVPRSAWRLACCGGSLTPFAASRAAPCSRSSPTTSVCPRKAADVSTVHPACEFANRRADGACDVRGPDASPTRALLGEAAMQPSSSKRGGGGERQCSSKSPHVVHCRGVGTLSQEGCNHRRTPFRHSPVEARARVLRAHQSRRAVHLLDFWRLSLMSASCSAAAMQRAGCASDTLAPASFAAPSASRRPGSLDSEGTPACRAAPKRAEACSHLNRPAVVAHERVRPLGRLGAPFGTEHRIPVGRRGLRARAAPHSPTRRSRPPPWCMPIPRFAGRSPRPREYLPLGKDSMAKL